jgi:hypothetical protein
VLEIGDFRRYDASQPRVVLNETRPRGSLAFGPLQRILSGVALAEAGEHERVPVGCEPAAGTQRPVEHAPHLVGLAVHWRDRQARYDPKAPARHLGRRPEGKAAVATYRAATR